MKLYSFTTLILALLMNSGICTLEMLTQDSNGVTCTEGLDCEISFGLCVPGDEEEPYFPVLVPTRIRSWNMLRCNRSHGCFPCVQVELDMSVDFLPEKLEDRKGENCDEYISDYDMIYDVDDDEDKFILDENFYPEPESQINGSSLCANLFISHTVPSTLTVCEMIRVRIPLSSVPPNHGNHSIKVGKVLYSCINMPPSANLFLTAFTQPRYHSVLNKTHRVPDCKALSRIEEIKACQVPSLNISITNNVSVYVIGKQNQLYNLSLVYKQNRDHKKRIFHILKDKEVLHIPEADIVPCLCFQVFCINLKDAVRGSYCPLENYSQYIENVWRKSDLSLTVLNTILMYEFTAPCNMSVEVVLCLKSGQNSQCQALPHSRKKVFIKDPQQFKNVKRHPSLCVQVRIKDRILHTKCPHANLSKSTERNEVIVQISHHPHPNSTLCIMERDTCRAVYNVSGQVPRATEILEKRVLKDFMTNKCIKVWSYSGVQEVYICPQDKYLRQRWSLAWVLCILVVSCILLFVILKRKEFEMCIKTMAGDHSLDEIFMDRKVLILYSPDNTEYEELVSTLASSLKDLKLTVIFDQWHRIEMSKVNALPWYHAQKSAVLEEKGIVLLLFSEGARERFIKWDNSTTQQRGDPYGTFGAALNCIVPDFIKGITPRRYVVGYFDCQFKQDDVPKIFQVVPILSLPSQVAKLLTELAGPKRNKLSKKRLHKLSAKVSARLKGAMQKCQQNGHHSSFAQNSGSETSVSYSSNGSKPLELYSLI